jgi:cell wall assembly regulator SMI1
MDYAAPNIPLGMLIPNQDDILNAQDQAQRMASALRGQQTAGGLLKMAQIPGMSDFGGDMGTSAEKQLESQARYGPEAMMLKRVLRERQVQGAKDVATMHDQTKLAAQAAGDKTKSLIADLVSQRRLAGTQNMANARVAAAQYGGENATAKSNDAMRLKFNSTLDAYQNPGLKPLREQVDRADAAIALATGDDGKYANLDKRQQYEIAMTLARLATGSSGRMTQQTISHLVPQSYRNDIAGFAEWFQNKAVPLEQQAFTKTLMNSIENEKRTAQAKMHQAARSNLSAYKPYIQSDPALAAAIMSDHGFDPDEFPELFNVGTQHPLPAPRGSAAPPPTPAPAPQGPVNLDPTAGATPAPPPVPPPVAPKGGIDPAVIHAKMEELLRRKGK